jgi:hypothetical protein
MPSHRISSTTGSGLDTSTQQVSAFQSNLLTLLVYLYDCQPDAVRTASCHTRLLPACMSVSGQGAEPHFMHAFMFI